MDINYYRHLNTDNEIGMSIPEIAKQVVTRNYGAQRMLAAILEERMKSDNMQYPSFAKHTKQLEDLLKTGWF